MPQSTYALRGLPAAQTQAGDFHIAFAEASASDQRSGRGVRQFNRDLAARTLTLGSALNAPSVSVLSTQPVIRMTATGTWQAQYGERVEVLYTENTLSRYWQLVMYRGYLDAAATT